MSAGPQDMEAPGPPPSEAAAPPPATDPASEAVELQDLINLGHPTDLSVCLEPLLKALEWRGEPRQMAEALPHFMDSVDITSFRNVLAALRYQSHAVETRMDKISLGLIPCLFLPDDRDAMVLLGFEGTHLNVFDSARAIYGAKEGYVRIQPKDWKGTAYVFTPLDDDRLLAEADGVSWFRALGERFRGLAYQVLGITLVLSLLALAVPLFVMAAFDGAIASGSAETLGYLGAGVGIAVLCDLVLRFLRARVFSFVGARLDNIVGVEVFRKIIYLPAALMEHATVGAQVARIKDFERVREFFTGPAAPVLFELPFVPIFIAVVAVLGGPVALVPIAALLLGGGLGLAVMPSIRKSEARAAAANAEKQEMTVEILGGMRAIKYTGAQTNWLERYRHLSATAALKNLYAAQFSSLMVTLSHVLMVGSGFATVIVGVFRVQGGDMTLGALVASMILVWRAVAPLRTWLVSLARLTQVETGVSHLNGLMRMVAERKAHPAVPADGMIDGKIRFNEVTIRYDPDSPPALHKVDFEVKSGKIVAIVGGNGAGKSTLLKLLAGMYAPDTGKILIDDRDTRAMDVGELRQAIAYVPQTAQFFYGTIAQNLRLAHPTASDQELRWAARQAGVLADIEALHQGSGEWRRTGFDVRIGDRGTGAFSPSLLQRLSLARAYLKRAPVVLLDEPGNGLDARGDQALIRALANMRGETTVFIVTHRPSHLKMADQIIWLEYGRVKATGQPKAVVEQTAGAGAIP